MAKYKVGDIFINHNDGKILQVCKGGCGESCCYFSSCWDMRPFPRGVSCASLVGTLGYLKELSVLPPGTRVKVREDLVPYKMYGVIDYMPGMYKFKKVTVKKFVPQISFYNVKECLFPFSLEMFDQVINKKENNNMETKEIKIDVPEGYEIDEENSTYECIKFKPIKKKLTYKDVAKELFLKDMFITNVCGEIYKVSSVSPYDKNNATNKKQLE